MSIIPPFTIKDRLRAAFYAQDYSFVKKYGLFIQNDFMAITAVDELVSQALLNRPSKRRNCRIAKLISYINSNNERGAAQLIASVGREAAKFNQMAFIVTAYNSDFAYEEDFCETFNAEQNNAKLYDNVEFKLLVKDGYIKTEKNGQLKWNF